MANGSCIWLLLLLGACATAQTPPDESAPLVDLAGVAPAIQRDLRYHTSNNFIGQVIDGYVAGQCLLSTPAALALQQAQLLAQAQGYSLKVYDCYRPQRAVDHFVRWAGDPMAQSMKSRFYPAVPKDQLFAQGYIARQSGHSRGSTVDLTLVPLNSSIPAGEGRVDAYDCRAPVPGRYPDNSIDMGTGYDCFDELSHTDHPAILPAARANRLLLRSIMEQAGFFNYAQEWWHYTLHNEPFPDTYFDIPT